MEIQFGLETEFGITRRDAASVDVVAESIRLVRSASEPGVRMRWDYALEDPHRDARGFRVDSLRQDTDESNYFAQDASRPLTFSEIKSDLALRNGARFYNDHAHPEYCTPECSTPLELLQQDLAGDELVMACLRTVNEGDENPVIIYKNNTDFQGHSYGCHENYLLPRRLDWDDLRLGIESFLVTRQIFCGTGKFGWEAEDRFLEPGFQISQRSDFFSVLQSVDTMQRRPLINTRDEPHADPERYRRFHVIIGDANLSPYATWLKVGTTAMVLQALADGLRPGDLPRVDQPLDTLKAISRDKTLQWPCLLDDRTDTTAIAIQRQIRDIVVKRMRPDGEWVDVADAWGSILDDLEAEPLSTADRLDWAAKFVLVDGFREAEGLDADDPWLRSLDLAYHQLDPEEGLYYGLRDGGAFRSPFDPELLSDHRLRPPNTTRAAIRGLCIEKFGPDVESAQWDRLVLRQDGVRVELDLSSLFDTDEIARSLAFVVASGSVKELAALPFARQA